MMTNIDDMSGKFLLSVPAMEDLNFRQTVILVCEHTKDGAFGLIVNRVLMNSFKPFLKAFDIEKSLVDLPIYYGGPVRPEQGYVIYSPCAERYGDIKVTKDLAVTASKTILHDIAAGKGPEQYIFALGFSGWASNQLEKELMADNWIVAPLDCNIIFSVPVSERWRSAGYSIGVDFDRFFNRTGRA